MNDEQRDIIVNDIFKIISDSSNKIDWLCKDNPSSLKDYIPIIVEYESQLTQNLNRLKEKLKEIDVNQPVAQLSTLLGYAAHHGWLDAVKYLVEEKGADVNQVGLNGKTPLHEAAWRNVDVVEYLIEKKADVNKIDENGTTPLHVAASFLSKFTKRPSGKVTELGFFRQLDIINSLIKAKAKVQKDIKGMTPLDLTSKNDAQEGLKFLIFPTLSSYPNHNKPNSIKENEELSDYWDKLIGKIDELRKKQTVGVEKQMEKFLFNIYHKENTLSSAAFFTFLDIKNSNKNVSGESGKIMPTPAARLSKHS